MNTEGTARSRAENTGNRVLLPYELLRVLLSLHTLRAHAVDVLKIVAAYASPRKCVPDGHGAMGIVSYFTTKGGQSHYICPFGSKTISMETERTSTELIVLITFERVVVRPTHYMIVIPPTQVISPRMWAFEASTDGNTWNVLSRHQEDKPVAPPSEFGCTWKVDAPCGYRCFRLRQATICTCCDDLLYATVFDIYGYAIPFDHAEEASCVEGDGKWMYD